VVLIVILPDTVKAYVCNAAGKGGHDARKERIIGWKPRSISAVVVVLVVVGGGGGARPVST